MEEVDVAIVGGGPGGLAAAAALTAAFDGHVSVKVQPAAGTFNHELPKRRGSARPLHVHLCPTQVPIACPSAAQLVKLGTTTVLSPLHDIPAGV